ncbi:hypothetical protein LTR84_011052 [Exophiala bonariae]|uniref:CID domain-containing protein n=1 Tax=Exophiala bonariae TaxID=1690606 RepID=A0AAV9NLS0_9EURO|nr:hypothetical protein LTR84_011052 [Exophiala bonariae]
MTSSKQNTTYHPPGLQPLQLHASHQTALMAAHHLSLAKATFAASLLRPDITKVSRDDITHFQTIFDQTLHKCTPKNIQACKQWLLENVLVSTTRTLALGKFLVSVARHHEPEAQSHSKSLVSRQRLHILYLLHDLFHHAKYHTRNPPVEISVPQSLQPVLPDLIQLASSQRKPKVTKRLVDLLDIWRQEDYFTKTEQAHLQNSLSASPTTSEPASQNDTKSAGAITELPYNIPSTHGDPSLPFYDLPAANLMHLIVPNSSQSIRPDEVRALQLSAGPADESLVHALKDFLRDVDRMDNSFTKFEDEGIFIEVDELGQIQHRNETESIGGDTYYGWSRAFCDKMKSRGKTNVTGAGFRRSQSSTSSRSLSRSRSRGRNRSQSRSERSRSHGRTQRKRRRYSGSSSENSRSPQSYNRSTSREKRAHDLRHYDNARGETANLAPYTTFTPHLPPRLDSSNQFNTAVAVPTIPFPGSPFQQTPSNVTNVFPPPPPNWAGIWPPPPPPPSFSGGYNHLGLPFPPNMANIPFPPGVSPLPPGVSPLPPGMPFNNERNGYKRQS